MQLATLQTFLAVVQTGALSRAAEQLNVSQSTVTARLNALEEEVGQPLFHRRRSGAELTSAGFKFQRYAELIGQLWKQARLETSLPEAISSVCNIGCQFDLWRGYAEGLVGELRDKAPEIAFSVWPGEQPDLDRWLRTGLVEAAFCHAPPQSEDLRQYVLVPQRLILVSTVPGGGPAAMSDYVFVDFGEGFRRSHAAAFPDLTTPMATFGSALLAVDYLKTYGGCAYLPEDVARPFLDAGALYRIENAATLHRPVFFVCNKRIEELTPVIPAYLKELAG